MSVNNLEQTLRNLSQHGKLIKDRHYRQVWRFEHQGKPYYLKFYPHQGTWWKRQVRGNPAMREFTRLQWLQKAEITAPRAVAVLVGLRLENARGDAVVIEAIEPAIGFDQYLNDLQLRGQKDPHHRDHVLQLCRLISKLQQAKLRHSDLHMGNLLLHEGKLYLLDGYAVGKGELRPKDVLLLGHSVQAYANRSDLLRCWRLLGNSGPLPIRNPASKRQYRKFMERTTEDNSYCGRLKAGEWEGHCFQSAKYPWRWSPVSGMRFTTEDWERAWPILLEQIESDQLTIIKRSASGDVLAGEVILGGRPVEVIVKRPRRRYWYRYFNEIGRGVRARRAWMKSWNLIARNLPTAWPMLLMEKRKMGYVTDAIFVCEKIPGPTLAAVNLDGMEANDRDLLLRRTGKILRQIEQFGFSHFDAKASNWIVREDDKLGPTPVLIDVDGIRKRKWIALGIERLLRSMREHPQYTPGDSLALCKGYAPFSRELNRQDAKNAKE